MTMADLGDLRLHYQRHGTAGGPPLVLAHALGTDLRLFDALVPLLPAELDILRVDMRGHGLSDAPPGPYAMGALVRDLERLMDHLALRDAVLVGVSIGGMIAQGLAVKRLDLLRGLVLSNTGAKIGTRDLWTDRVAMLRDRGFGAVADATLERWLPKAFRASAEGAAWRNLLLRNDLKGYAACAEAIAGTDFYTSTATLRLPTLGIAGSEDSSTPPDLVRETVDLIPGSRFALVRNAGHLPCVDQPDAYGELINGFLADIGHVGGK